MRDIELMIDSSAILRLSGFSLTFLAGSTTSGMSLAACSYLSKVFLEGGRVEEGSCAQAREKMVPTEARNSLAHLPCESGIFGLDRQEPFLDLLATYSASMLRLAQHPLLEARLRIEERSSSLVPVLDSAPCFFDAEQLFVQLEHPDALLDGS